MSTAYRNPSFTAKRLAAKKMFLPLKCHLRLRVNLIPAPPRKHNSTALRYAEP